MMAFKPYTPHFTPAWPLAVMNICFAVLALCLVAGIVGLVATWGEPSQAVLYTGIVFLADMAVMLITVSSALIMENLHRHKQGLTPVAMRGGRHWEHGRFMANQIINGACFALGIYAAYLAFALATA